MSGEPPGHTTGPETMHDAVSNLASTPRGRGLAGTGLVAIWNGIRQELREDFFEWHPREHMVERLGIPGFLRGRRCIAIEGDPEFLTLYEVRAPEVLLSETYRTRLGNPTAWSAKTLPAFTNNTRGACRVLFTEGYAMGGAVLTLRFEAEPGRGQALVDAVVREAMPRFLTMPRITGAHLVRNDASLTAGNVGRQHGRVILTPDLIVVVEGSDAGAVKTAGESILSDERLRAWGSTADIPRGLYRLEYSIQNLT